MTLAARDAADRVEQLIMLTKRLTELARRETALFEARRPLETKAFEEEAAGLAAIYRQECAAIKNNPDLVAGAPADRRAALRQLTEEMHEVLTAHAQAVSGLRGLTEGLVQAVADHVAEMRRSTARYGPNATVAERDARAAITLDRTT